nr:MAG TPA: hypothetical protein [Caudoviricetes sp.]
MLDRVGFQNGDAEALQTLFDARRQTYRLNIENGSGTPLRGCERIVEVCDYCRRGKWNT